MLDSDWERSQSWWAQDETGGVHEGCRTTATAVAAFCLALSPTGAGGVRRRQTKAPQRRRGHPPRQRVRQLRLRGPLRPSSRRTTPASPSWSPRRATSGPTTPSSSRRSPRAAGPVTWWPSRRARSSTSCRAPDKFVNFQDHGSNDEKDQWLDWKYDQATTADGADTIGLGTDVGGLAMCYRSDLFEKAGLPDRPRRGEHALADLGRLHRHRREVPGRHRRRHRPLRGLGDQHLQLDPHAVAATTPTSTPTATWSSTPTRRSRRPGTSR